MKQSKKQKKRAPRQSLWVFVAIAAVLVACCISVVVTITQTADRPSEVVAPASLRTQYAALDKDLQKFLKRQQKAHSELAAPDELQDRLSHVQWEIAGGQFGAARKDMLALQASLDNWNLQLGGPPPHESIIASSTQAPTGGVFIPIILYHYTPPNFDEQLTYLEQRGYTVIDLDQALAGLEGEPLPDKPVVLTFDDGFANQMQAFAILQQHHMKATFYIINGGSESRWCIGAGRRYGDPLQPPNGCGDAYLTWDQVRTLDRSGLITIAGHTLDHANLPMLSEEDQRHEIADSKAQIEQQIGHQIRHFAYPYGAYDATTAQLVAAAGYATAVTTVDGEYQTASTVYELKRIRDAMALP